MPAARAQSHRMSEPRSRPFAWSTIRQCAAASFRVEGVETARVVHGLTVEVHERGGACAGDAIDQGGRIEVNAVSR